MCCRLFQTGGRIAKDRIFLDCCNGGLGLPNQKDFLTSLKVSIYRKGIKANDSWGKDLGQLLAEPKNPYLYKLIKKFQNITQFFYNLVKPFL